MSDNVVPFPEDRSLFANIDAHLQTIDAIPEPEKATLIRLAIDCFGKLMDAQESDDRPGSLVAAVDALLLSYLALGTILGAKRDLMVASLRHE
jgi:hypothetical protein